MAKDTSPVDGYYGNDDLDLDKSEVCSVDSLGWLYKETEDLVVILADKDTHNKDDLYGRSQVIPKGVIKDIKYLS